MTFKLKYPIPKELREIIEADVRLGPKGFLGPVIPLYDPHYETKPSENKTPLQLKTSGSDASVEYQVLEDGRIQVSYRSVLDNNTSREDGALFQLDHFIYDASWRRYASYRREYTYNGAGDRAQWEKWLKLFQDKAHCATTGKIDHCPSAEKIGEFSEKLGRSSPRPLTDSLLRLGPIDRYMGPTREQLASRGLEIVLDDARNYYTVIRHEKHTEIIFAYVVRDSKNPDQGFAYLKDHFTLLNQNLSGTLAGRVSALGNYRRSFEVTYRGPYKSEWDARIVGAGSKPALNATPGPGTDDAWGFISAYLRQGLLHFVPAVPSRAESDDPGVASPIAQPTANPRSRDEFKRVMRAASSQDSLRELVDYEVELAEALKASEAYFSGLNMFISSWFVTIDPKDPSFKIGVQIEGSTTRVHLDCDLLYPTTNTSSTSARLHLRHTFIFEGQVLKDVTGEVQVLGEDPQGVLNEPRDDIQKFVVHGGAFDASSPLVKLLMDNILPYVAPHLVEYAQPRALDRQGLSVEDVFLYEAIADLREDFIRLLYRPNQAPSVSMPILRALQSATHDDVVDAVDNLRSLQNALVGQLEYLADDRDKLKSSDYLRLAQVLERLFVGEIILAREIALEMASPVLRNTLLKTLDQLIRRRQIGDGLAIAYQVAFEDLEIRYKKSTAYLYMGPKIDKEAEQAAIQALFQKALRDLRVGQADTLEDVLAGLADLNPTEEAVRSRLLQLPWARRVSDVFAIVSTDPLRARAYERLAEDLYREKMIGSARAVAEYAMRNHLPASATLTSLKIFERLADEMLSEGAKRQGLETDMVYVSLLQKALSQAKGAVANDAKAGTRDVNDFFEGLTDLEEDELDLLDQLLDRADVQALLKVSKIKDKGARRQAYRVVMDAHPDALPNAIQILQEIDQDKLSGSRSVEVILLVGAILQSEGRGRLRAQAPMIDARLAGVQKNLRALFDRAYTLAALHPEYSLLQILQSLPVDGLNPEESELRSSLLELPQLTALGALALTTDPNLRAQQSLGLAEEWAAQGLAKTAIWIQLWFTHEEGQAAQFESELSEEIAALQTDTSTGLGALLAASEGRGNFGQYLHFNLGFIADSLLDWKVIAAMGTVPLTGPVLEMAGLRVLGQLGWPGRFMAGGLRAVGEGNIFVTMMTLLHASFDVGEGAWKGFGDRNKTASLTFGLLHLGNGAVNQFVRRWLARGRTGFGWAGGVVAAEGAEGVLVTPLGGLAPLSATGQTVGQLTLAGERFAALIYHASGISMFFNASVISQEMSWEERSQFGLLGTLGGSVMFYLHAMVAFNIAGSVTGGALQLRLMEMGFRLENYRASLRPQPAAESLEGVMRLSGSDPVSQPAESDVARELSALAPARQMTLAKRLERPGDLRELLALLEHPDFATLPALRGAILAVLRGEGTLQALPIELGIRQRVMNLMEAQVRALSRYGFSSLDFVLEKGAQPESRTPAEVLYHTAVAWVRLSIALRGANNFTELATALRNSRFDSIEGHRVADVLRLLQLVDAAGGERVHELPLILRQRARDILEERVLTAPANGGHTALPLPVGEIPLEPVICREIIRDVLPQNPLHETAANVGRVDRQATPSLRELYHRLDAMRTYIFDQVGATSGASTPYRRYTFLEIEELINRVLDRGWPLEILPVEGRIRENVQQYQAAVVAVAERLFVAEMNVETNPYTGEYVGRGDAEARYRLAFNVMNQRARRPVFGLPSTGETQTLHHLVARYLNHSVGPGHVEALRVLRGHLDALSPEAVAMLQKATPEEKAILLHSYFGLFYYRDIPSESAAFQLTALFGLAGMVREVGVVYDIESDRGGAVIGLGGLNSFMANGFAGQHTHPARFKDPQGQVMTEMAGGKRSRVTLDLGSARAQADYSSLMFSGTDLSSMIGLVEHYASTHSSALLNSPFFTSSPGGGGVFRTYVTHPLGASEAQMHLSTHGRVSKVVVHYALRDGARLRRSLHEADRQTYQTGLVQIQSKVDSELRPVSDARRIPLEAEEVAFRDLTRARNGQDGMPFELGFLNRRGDLSAWRYHGHRERDPYETILNLTGATNAGSGGAARAAVSVPASLFSFGDIDIPSQLRIIDPFAEVILLGSGDSASVRIAEAGISPLHAMIRKISGNGYTIEAFAEGAAIEVNNIPIPLGHRPRVQNGSLITLGNFEFVLHIP